MKITINFKSIQLAIRRSRTLSSLRSQIIATLKASATYHQINLNLFSSAVWDLTSLLRKHKLRCHLIHSCNYEIDCKQQDSVFLLLNPFFFFQQGFILLIKINMRNIIFLVFVFFFFFFFNDTATTEIYTLHIVGSVRCVQETVSTQSTWGIRYIDLVLGQFGLDLNDKIALFETLSKGYGIEFNMNKSLKVNLDTKLRYHKSQIEKIFSINEGTQFPLYDALLKTIDISKLPIENILKIKTANKLEIAFESLLVSIIHMHYNRLFRTQQRLYELVIYYSMHKFYKSLAARIINNPSIKILVYQ
eukprot:TRINITY_DN6355_c0_g2_i5.p1 TRINITY_DN6355_c0_g2~~TRINITY_DN6355_c0_g2_i5.p1  ORF type:complete len:304 (+),score=45.44 TRINITY_DN6355_c0_g2_i5:594-1505(+)